MSHPRARVFARIASLLAAFAALMVVSGAAAHERPEDGRNGPSAHDAHYHAYRAWTHRGIGLQGAPSMSLRDVSAQQDRVDRISARLQSLTQSSVRISVDPMGAMGGGGISSADGISLDPDVVRRMSDPGLAGLMAHEIGHQVMRHASPAHPAHAAWAREWGERDCDRFAGWLLAASGYQESSIDAVAPFLYEFGSVVTGHADRVERLTLYREGYRAFTTRALTTLAKVLEWLPSSPGAASFALHRAAAAPPLEAGGPGERRRAVSPWSVPVVPRAVVAAPRARPRTPFPIRTQPVRPTSSVRSLTNGL
ncbi:MAG: hypothetical protein IT379_31325 [Deltaproteobacteria bacterium]|nr:hypothetical protein [Deltaproteobacteria bacterium]